MLIELLAATALQVGPFGETRTNDYFAVRPFYSREGETTDVLWPLFTKHRDWWRFCLLVHEQDEPVTKEGVEPYQFDITPLWFNGRTRTGEEYAGLFPIYGHHPNLALVYDLDFCLWPLWMQYKTPRHGPDGRMRMATSRAVLFPFVTWRDDGSWGLWPFYGINHQRESDHQYVYWPLITWAKYREDRDTSGEGYSWMLWPLYAQVRRARERQDLFLPPFFSWTETWSRRPDPRDSCREFRLRCPWPFFELEHTRRRDRLSVFPFYEHVEEKTYHVSSSILAPSVSNLTSSVSATVTRYGWKLVELYDDETRVFPFWVSRKDDAYFRLWPFYESERVDAKGEVRHRSVLALMPIRWVDAVDRNWAKFWTFYEAEENPVCTDHSLFWGIIRWRTYKE